MGSKAGEQQDVPGNKSLNEKNIV